MVCDISRPWQNIFGLIESQVTGAPANGFDQVSCAGAGAFSRVVGVGSDSERYRTIRYADDTGQNSFELI